MDWIIRILSKNTPIWVTIILVILFGMKLTELNSQQEEVIGRSDLMNQDIETQLKKLNSELKIELDSLYRVYKETKDVIDLSRASNPTLFTLSSQDVLRGVEVGLKPNSGTYGNKETTLPTSIGAISCQYRITKDSGDNIASIKFGQNGSKQSEALIKAFISESTNFKLANGYKLIDSKKSAVNYGEIVQKQYAKNDLYFKTYFEYTRHQGTYNSINYTYSYYIEIGSISVSNKLKQESFGKKIGS